MRDEQPQIALTKIDFPSDCLSIKDLRKLFPSGFDGLDQWGDRATVNYFRDVSDSGVQPLIWMLRTEREIAGSSFNMALGRPASHREDRSNQAYWDSAKEELAQSLIEYGIASGRHHAEQLVRDIEAQAVSQAKAFGQAASK